MSQDETLNIFHVLLFNWWTKNKRSFPWRADDVSPYQMLVTEMLLWKTRAESVANIWSDFFTRFPDPETLAAAGEDEIAEQIASLGLSKRAECLKQMAQKLQAEHGGSVPSQRERLLELMGIGDYAASAALCFAFDRDVAIVDANVKRILTRVFGCKENEVEVLAESLVPKDAGPEWGYALLDLGAFLCCYKPLCKECPLRPVCVTGQNA